MQSTLGKYITQLVGEEMRKQESTIETVSIQNAVGIQGMEAPV